MTNDEKIQLLNKEIDEMFEEYFEKAMKQSFENELESVKYADEFHAKLYEYIKIRKEELNISAK